MAPFADLNTTWFALIGLLWAGYLFLEGFDFGVSVVDPVRLEGRDRSAHVPKRHRPCLGRQ